MSQLSPNRRAHLGGSGAHPKIETAPGIADERRPGASQGARERTRTSTAKNGHMALNHARLPIPPLGQVSNVKREIRSVE
jgi:hypothetical protein